MKTNIICTKCDEAFSVEYSKYSSRKTVKCPTCGIVLDLPRERIAKESVNPNAESLVSENTKNKAFSMSWHIENRYMHSGVICFTLGLFFLAVSLYSFNIYVPFFILALIFGVLAIVDKKPLPGIILIVVTVLVAAFTQNYLMNREVEEFIQELNDYTNKTTEEINDYTEELEKMSDAFEKQLLNLFK